MSIGSDMFVRTKPFACAVCKRRFGRRDVYQRHLRSQHPDQASIVPSERRQGACDSCHRRKVKCTLAEHPCERCHREGVECTFQRTLSDSTARALFQTNHPQTSIPETNSCESFLDPQSPPNAQDWHDTISSNSHDVMPLSPGLSLPFQDTIRSNELALGILDLEFTQLDFNILDQMPSFPSLDLLPAPVVPETRPDSHSARITGAFAQLKAYSLPTDLSQPASPGAKQDHENWLYRLGKKLETQYDPLVVNVFLNLFRLHVAKTFQCFEKFTTTDSTPVELWASMASVGALYCTTPGSIVLAKSLYNHARIILLSKV
ncbi:hypothetical protein N7462_002538 [Penicillium macrosclerotiorum]|uniref:uncharacterized protein n=1 Tax=Penicillium macrosclerotiorum TaxID=303699 RepID=UPI002546685A|nr:uncharacterized protein N7462_002538 [Penicillium macrosclerotiorum]KAJ5693115.1 hypothetical protein N7462_002538 [Penicillium macrosclerotiorum]